METTSIMTKRSSITLSSFLKREFAVASFPPTWFIFQPLAGICAFLGLKLGLSPNGMTLLGGILGLYSMVQFATIPIGVSSSATLTFLLLMVYTMDCADGQLARASKNTSLLGQWIDLSIDLLLIVLLPISIAFLITPHFSILKVSQLTFILIFGRSLSLLTSSMKRAAGQEHKPSPSILKKCIQSIVDTPVFYICIVWTRLNPEILYNVSILYGILFFIESIYFARTFRS